jgi:hypothetical protein
LWQVTGTGATGIMMVITAVIANGATIIIATMMMTETQLT